MKTNYSEERNISFGNVNAVELVGSYREMGWQYGRALKNKITAFYDLAINKLFIKEFGMAYEHIVSIGRIVFKQFPDRFKEMVIGIAEGSGLGLDKIAILQQMTVLAEFSERKGCSNMVVWGDHSKDRNLIWGRTFDMPKFYRMFAEYLTVITCRPGDSNISVTAFVYAGQIDAYTVMNDRGIFISVDEAILSAGGNFAHDRIPVSIIPLSLALDYSDIEAVGSALNSIRPGWPVIITAGDKDGASSFEYTISDCKKTGPFSPAVVVATNHFVNPKWGIGEPPFDKGLSVPRRKNLLGAADKYRGSFDHQKMAQILDTPIDQGGVYRPQTVYSVVAIPKDLKMHLKVPDHQDWIEIDAGISESLPETV
jgi:hypothetical protein